MCNHERFLEQQELECRRIARSCNEGTQNYDEWNRTARALLERRKEHISVCKQCKQETAKQAI
jgi:hypothetical protein